MDNRILKYFILSGRSPAELVKAVNEKMENGTASPYGSPFFHPNTKTLCQAMVRYEEGESSHEEGNSK